MLLYHCGVLQPDLGLPQRKARRHTGSAIAWIDRSQVKRLVGDLKGGSKHEGGVKRFLLVSTVVETFYSTRLML